MDGQNDGYGRGCDRNGGGGRGCCKSLPLNNAPTVIANRHLIDPLNEEGEDYCKEKDSFAQKKQQPASPELVKNDLQQYDQLNCESSDDEEAGAGEGEIDENNIPCVFQILVFSSAQRTRRIS